MNNLGKKPKNPAQNTACPKKPADFRWISVLLAVMLLLSACPALAEEPEGPPDGDFEFGGSSGSSGMQTLTDENFSLDDMPKGYIEESKNPGRVEKVRYVTSDAVYVYMYHILPALFVGYQ